MANVKISQLPNLGNLASGTQFPVASAGNTFSVTSDTIKTYVVGSGFSVGNSIISNVATPIASTDAATRGYVDSATSAAITFADDQAQSTAINLGDTLTFNGTANEVVVGITTGNVTIGLPDDVVITGNLTVNGTTTTINSNVITTNDLAITLGNNQSTGTALNGAGIDVGNNSLATWKFNNATTSWQSNIAVMPTANGTLTLGGTSNYWGAAYVTSLTSTGNVAAGNLSVSTGTITLGGIINANANGVGNIGSSGTQFNTVFAKATSAQYADLAEKYTADADYAPGTVVKFGGSAEITVCNNDHDPEIAGVVSTNPAHIMNAGLQGTHVTAVALTGRVPCHVQGPVRRGQMLVSAGNGRARAETHPAMGTVIGKALEDFNGDIGTIEAVVGRL